MTLESDLSHSFSDHDVNIPTDRHVLKLFFSLDTCSNCFYQYARASHSVVYPIEHPSCWIYGVFVIAPMITHCTTYYQYPVMVTEYLGFERMTTASVSANNHAMTKLSINQSTKNQKK